MLSLERGVGAEQEKKGQELAGEKGVRGERERDAACLGNRRAGTGLFPGMRWGVDGVKAGLRTWRRGQIVRGHVPVREAGTSDFGSV